MAEATLIKSRAQGHTNRRVSVLKALQAAILYGWALRPSAGLLLCLVLLVLMGRYGFPYLRWSYSYQDQYGVRRYLSCDYLGPKPFTLTNELDCPLIIISKEGRYLE